jgi:hypothetical protein
MVDQLMGQMWKIVHLQLQLGDTLKFDLPLRSIKQNNAYPIFPWAVDNCRQNNSFWTGGSSN